MAVFADSSALVTLYANEPESDAVHAWRSELTVSSLARVEVPAALWRKHRGRDLSLTETLTLIDEFEADFLGDETGKRRFTVVPVTVEILDAAAELCAIRGLRAYDAIQLATALAVREVDARCSRFAAFDDQLRTAAAAERFELIP